MMVLRWDLLLIPMIVGAATVLILVCLTKVRVDRAKRDRPPEGTLVGILTLMILVAAITLLVLVSLETTVLLNDD